MKRKKIKLHDSCSENRMTDGCHHDNVANVLRKTIDEVCSSFYKGYYVANLIGGYGIFETKTIWVQISNDGECLVSTNEWDETGIVEDRELIEEIIDDYLSTPMIDLSRYPMLKKECEMDDAWLSVGESDKYLYFREPTFVSVKRKNNEA